MRDNAHLKHPTVANAVNIEDVPKPFRRADGLAGGVGWAFDSKNIVDSVWRNPDSDAGRLERIRFTALGGYGEQRGLFDLRRTAIETTTSLGRVHRYKLERVGRISCLWNRAKHVIIYERTVVPSPQFVNVNPAIGNGQDYQTGRAVVRKVEEFVEILEPVRRFDSDADPSEPGCLLAASFLSTKIRVDSRWGRDVRREGWEVPLWRRELGEAPTEEGNPFPVSSIYPKPKVNLGLIDEEGQEVSCEVDHPEKLCFFTSTEPGVSDDTDAWRPYSSVDYPDASEPTIAEKDFHPLPITDGELPSAAPEPPGWARFTLGLVRDGKRIRIGHGRNADGVAAALSNVTVARSTRNASAGGDVRTFDKGLADVVGSVELGLDYIRAARDNLNPANIDQSVVNLREEAQRRFDELKLHEIHDKIKVKIEDGIKSAEKVKNFLRQGCEPVRREVDRALDQGHNRLQQEINSFANDAGRGVSSVAVELRQAASNSITQAVALIDGAINDINEIETAFRVRAITLLEPNFGLVDQRANEILAVVAEAKRARAEIIELELDLRAEIGELKNKPDEAAAKLEEIAQKVDAARRRLAAKNSKAAQLAARVLAGTLRLVHRTRRELTNVADEIEVALTNLSDTLKSAAASEHLKDVEATLSVIEKQVAAIKKMIRDTRNATLFPDERLPGFEAVTDRLTKLKGDLVDAVDQAEIDQLVSEFERSAHGLVVDLQKATSAKLTDARDAIRNVKKDVDDVVTKICTAAFAEADEIAAAIKDQADKLAGRFKDFENKAKEVVADALKIRRVGAALGGRFLRLRTG